MLYIHGMGHFHPENVIDNAFFESLNIDTTDQWIMERIGIKRRRTVLPLSYIKETHNSNQEEANKVSRYTDGQTGAGAAKMALERAGLTTSDIGMVIGGSSIPQYVTPSMACMVASELGIAVPSFDVNSACPTFNYQIHNLMSMRPETLPDYVLVVVVDNVTRAVDYNDRKTAVLFGDCSAAMIVSPRVPSKMTVDFSVIENDPVGWNKVGAQKCGYIFQDGPAVQSFAIRKTEATVKLLRKKLKGDPENMYFIGHQANFLMLEAVRKRCNIDPLRHLYNVDEFGNCGCAGAPGVLSMNWDKFKHGDEIAVAVVGAGLSWSGLLLKVRGE